MSKKLTGNGLWESRRMMIPQHKERINLNLKEHKLKKRPTLHEDEWETIVHNLSISMNEKETVEVSLFGKYEDKIYVGIVTRVIQHQKKFRLDIDDYYEWIDFKEIVSVRL